MIGIGAGGDLTREAGIDIDLGVYADEAKAVNTGFLLHRTLGRPLVTLKTASTLTAGLLPIAARVSGLPA